MRKKTDANQRAITAALRKCRIKYWDTSAVGGGFPDLVVIHRGMVHLVEVKNPEYRWRFTQRQEEEMEILSATNYHVVVSFDDLARCIGLYANS